MTSPKAPAGFDRRLRIGLDGRPLAGRIRGVGRYVRELGKELDRLLPEARFYVYNRKPVELPVDSERWISRSDSFGLGRRLSPLAWLKLRCGVLARQDRVDVFWGTNLFLPSIPPPTRTLVTVYDLSFSVVPETYHRSHLWSLRWFLRSDLRRANVVTTCSAGTAERLQKILGVTTTAVLQPSVSAAFHPRSEDEIAPTLERLGIARPYLLTVATWEPRKNLATLLHAWTSLVAGDRVGACTLVLAGQKFHKHTTESQLVAAAGKDRVVDLDYVPDDHLPALYTGAEALVFPSTYEGFGIPVLEARACGTPVVTTDIPELREAGGDDAIYVEPTEEGLSRGIEEVLRQHRRLDPLTDLPTWRDQAQKLAELLQGRP